MKRGDGGFLTSVRSAPRSIFHYLTILRDRWVSAALAFAVTVAVVTVVALFATPVYESKALIQLEMNRRPGDELAQIAMMDAWADVDGEIQVIQSHRVAERAAVLAGVGVLIREPNAYRPWESLVRRFKGQSEPPRLRAQLATRPLPAGDHDVRLVFNRRGTTFSVYDAATDRKLSEDDFNRQVGTEVELGDVQLHLKTEGGAPRGATYRLSLRAGQRADQRVEPEAGAADEGTEPNEAAAPGELPTLVVATGVRAMPKTHGTWRVRFASDGKGFELLDRAGRSVISKHDWDPVQGALLTIADDEIRIESVEGDPAGHEFLLELKTARFATQWMQSLARAAQRGTYTGLIDVAARTTDPYLAQRCADAIAASYLERKQALKDDQILRRLSWLKGELVEARKDLKLALDARDAYIAKAGAVLLSERAQAALEAQRTLFEQRLVQQEIRDRTRAKLKALETTTSPEQILAVVGEGSVDAQTQAIADKLVQLRVERGALLRGRSTAEDRAVKRLDDEIAELQDTLDRRGNALLAEVKADLERRMAATEKRLEHIAEEQEEHAKTLRSLPETERGLGEATRAVEAVRQRVAFLEQRRGESEIALTSNMTEAHLVDHAVLDAGRKSPVLFRQALIALFLGTLAGVGMALLRHLRDRSVQTPSDLEEYVELPVLATIPRFSTVPRRQRKGLEGSLPVRDVPGSVLAENYRTLRANIRFADTPKRVQALTMTSAVPSEGKTVSTLNLALAMAAAGDTVVVVDADMRRPMVDVHLDGERTPGLTDVLQGGVSWREALQACDGSGVRYLAAGANHPNPSALLEGERFDTLLAELREAFDYVLFDVPPVLAVADAAGFYSDLDAVLLVSRQGACPIDVVRSARDQVVRFGGTLLGAVYNGFDAGRASSVRYGYGGYYGYHAYYGGGYHDPRPRKDKRRARKKDGRGASTEVS